MFVNRSELLSDNPTRMYGGIAVSDIDGDGSFELLAAASAGANRVLKWTGREFVDIAEGRLAGSDRDTLGAIAADIDGDGREELYLLESQGDRLLQYRDRAWEPMSAIDGISGCSAVCVDRFGKGRYSILVLDDTRGCLYELDPWGTLANTARAAGLFSLSGLGGIVALPLVSDSMDIFIVRDRGVNTLFRNNGDGTFTDATAEAGVDDSEQRGRGVAVLDADGDGKFDLVCANWDGLHRLFLQGATGHFRNVAPKDMARSSHVRTVIAADFDNDGIEELFFHNQGEPNRLFGLRDGAWRQLDIGEAWEPDDWGTGAVVGDFDGDGGLELLVARGDGRPRPLSLYRAANICPYWLRVLPLTPYGAPARGAICRLSSGGRWQIRAIDAGSGYLCQNEPVAHFGLGDRAGIDRLEVRWPDGTRVTIDSPAPNQLLRVSHPQAVKG